MDIRVTCIITIGLCCGLGANVHAQIAIDTTLGDESSELAPRSVGGTQIQGGAVRGESLFHSFTEFNVDSGEQVFFANPANVEMIVGRVTGNDASDIFGTLGVDGTASLYLLNPNGFLFGPDARLDIPGSFFASTATSLDLGNGVEFSAIAPAPVPMLTVSVPVGLQPGRTFAGDIVSRSEFLSVGGDLGLAASKVELQGGLILQGSGDVHIRATELLKLQGSSAVGSPSRIVTGFEPGTDSHVGDVLIETSRLVLEDGSAVVSFLLGQEEGGNLTIWAEESVELRGQNLLGERSIIASDGQRGMTNTTGNIFIKTDHLVLEDGSAVGTTVSGEGKGGNLTIWAEKVIELRGQNPVDGPSVIVSNGQRGTTSNTGNIFIRTGRLILEDGAAIATRITEQGNGGNLTIWADESVELRGQNPVLGNSSLIAATVTSDSTGNAGSILINTGRLVLESGTAISSFVFGEGNAGNVTIRADESVELLGGTQTSDEDLTLISSIVASDAVGEAGDLLIETGRLVVENGAAISSSVLANGNGGNLTIRTDESVELRAGSILTNVEPGGSGNAGDLLIETGRLVLDNGSVVSSSTRGQGNGGTLTIRATEAVELRGQNLQGRVSEISTSVLSSTVGNAGDLSIKTGQLLLDDTTVISTSSSGTGSAGDLDIWAEDWILMSGNSTLSATTAGGGTVGSITVTTAQLTVQDNGELAVSAEGSFPAGTLTVNVDKLKLSDNASLRAETEVGDEGGIIINAQGVVMQDNSSISTDASESATGGNIIIGASDFVLLSESSRLEARAVTGQGGNIDISTDFFLQSDNSRIDASSDFGVNGSVNLNTLELNPVPTVDALPTSFVTVAVDQRCTPRQADSRSSRFVQTGRGGLASDADAITRAGLWADMRFNEQDLFTSMQGQSKIETNSSESQSASQIVSGDIPDQIVEAQVWSRNSSGQVVLMAAETTAMMLYSSLSPASNCLAE